MRSTGFTCLALAWLPLFDGCAARATQVVPSPESLQTLISAAPTCPALLWSLSAEQVILLGACLGCLLPLAVGWLLHQPVFCKIARAGRRTSPPPLPLRLIALLEEVENILAENNRQGKRGSIVVDSQKPRNILKINDLPPV